MTLREQVEALPCAHRCREPHGPSRQAVLDLIDAHGVCIPESQRQVLATRIQNLESGRAAHRCIDPERLARAVHRALCDGDLSHGRWGDSPDDLDRSWARHIYRAYEKEDNL